MGFGGLPKPHRVLQKEEIVGLVAPSNLFIYNPQVLSESEDVTFLVVMQKVVGNNFTRLIRR